uniref:Phylloseptin-Az3 n=3 Tax=Pithecopus TaxID=1911155 RepID=PLS3_PITAZ|nr:RecName: Full=Phylloseptin-Az3; Short=PLS-Az3; AltName: Full=Phylloseptin-8; Short=PS-8; Flags: Precursor [Pithecopus azureus]Q0VZ41.1 RecName: Full=Phylloseptin-H6; Short=PLS-H6; AltName: Full=Phylloseptin-8; Short=PS-8; Flags: Precursor [Pithecopus hypochondrialis]CAJ76135.1 pyhlloseptin-8 protein precursor [Pithecopus hypochondrialis]
MAFLKKSLFLVLFLGLVSLSICEEEKRETEEEEYNQEDDDKSEEKRFLSLIPTAINAVSALAKHFG